MAGRQRQDTPPGAAQEERVTLFHPVTGEEYETGSRIEAVRLKAHGYLTEPRSAADAPPTAGHADPRVPSSGPTRTGGPFVPPGEDELGEGGEVGGAG